MKDVFARIQAISDVSPEATLSRQWRAGAADILKSSSAYSNRDVQGLSRLAAGLRDANIAQIKVVRDFPEVFHANVARSREIENEVYEAVSVHID